jgi:hypothetical protein
VNRENLKISYEIEDLIDTIAELKHRDHV